MSDASQIENRPASRRVGALSGLWPFLRVYRGLLTGSFVALC